MATADKLNYLLETKVKIKDAINNDISLIEEDTIFREYADKINNLSDTLKKFIPTEIKTGSSIQISGAAPLNAKSLIVYGNSYQKTTKGINLFNYLENIGTIAGLTITTEDDYIVLNGTTVNNYQLAIKDIDLTDMLEDGETYTLWQENDAKSSSSDTFPKTAIRLRTKHANGNYVYTRVTKSKVVSFSVDKSAFEEYCVDVVTPVVGEAYSNYKNKFMLVKGEYDDNTIPNFEPYTKGASPSPNCPQNIDVIDSVKIINRSDQLVDFSKFVVLADGTTSSFENDTLSVSSGNNRYNRIEYDILDLIKNNPGKILYFDYENYDFSNGNNAIVQIKYALGDRTKYKTLLNDSGNNYSFVIPEDLNNFTSAKLEIFSNNTSANIQSSISITKPMLQFGTDKLEYGTYHNDKYTIDLQGNFIGNINNAKDTLDLATGILTKKIKKIVFDGSKNEKWNIDILQTGCSLRSFYTNVVKNEILPYSKVLANRLNYNNDLYLNDNIGIDANWNGAIRIKLGADVSILDELIDYLSNNPLIVYYQLKKPEIIQLAPVKIKMYEGANNIELMSNLETEMTLEYYKDYKTNEEVTSEVIV